MYMLLVIKIFLTYLFVVVTLPAFSQAKRAINLMEKEKYEQATAVLYKSMNNDSLNAGERYAFSLLFFNRNYLQYNIDSAYFYILTATEDFKKSEDKIREKLAKDGIDYPALTRQKISVEQLAFELTGAADTEGDYIRFIDKYPTSEMYDSAIWYRNERAWEQAVKKDNWRSYESLMLRYPDAAHYNETKSRYELLIYEDKTKDGKLQTYRKFLQKYPDTPYRNEVEYAIFNIATGDHAVSGYESFIREFPESEMAVIATQRIYFILGFSSFVTRQSAALLDLDSLQKLAELDSGFLFPVYEHDGYTFMNERGNKVITRYFKHIFQGYRCGNISDKMLLVELEGKTCIINRAGINVFSSPGIAMIQTLGAGMLKYMQDGLYGVILKNGRQILKPEFEDVRLLQGSYIGFLVGGKWGVMSVNGIRMLEAEFDNIDNFGPLIRIYQNDHFALMAPSGLKPLLDGEKVNFEFRYDDAEIIGDEKILVYSGELQGLTSTGLNKIVPEAEQEIILLKNGILLQLNNGYRYISDTLEISPALVWDDADFNENWTVLKGKNGWLVISELQKRIVEEHIDSLAILNKATVIIHKNGKRKFLFVNGRELNLTANISFQMLSSPPTATSEPSYYYKIKQLKKFLLINQYGDTLNLPKNNAISALGSEYLVYSWTKKKGLLDSLGNTLLPAKYDGIANYKSGFVTTLKDGKLGLYRLSDAAHIPAEYDKSLSFYNDTLLIAVQNKKTGLIDRQNNSVIPFKYEAIRYFNDSSAWVKTHEEWSLLNFINKKLILEGITDVEENTVINDQYVIFSSNKGKGVIHRKNGTIISNTFNEIVNIGSEYSPVFLAEKFIEEADYYVIVIYNKDGTIIFRNAYDNIAYEHILCEK